VEREPDARGAHDAARGPAQRLLDAAHVEREAEVAGRAGEPGEVAVEVAVALPRQQRERLEQRERRARPGSGP
jgi:hypothetical protein